MRAANSSGRTVRVAELARTAAIETGPLRIAERKLPTPGPGEVLIEVGACALCRTDLQICSGDLGDHGLPRVPGHQVVGRVVEAGLGSESKVGRRVGLIWLAGACGQCRWCRDGLENLCPRATFTGWDRDGGCGTHVVADADFVVDLPDSMSDVDVAPLLCGGVIGYRALRATGLDSGGRLGLFGFGASASLVLPLARYLGMEVFVATRSRSEQVRALEQGAAWAGGYDDNPPYALDAAITFAPVGDVVVSALAKVARAGTVVINAIHLDRIPEFPYELLWHERRIQSVANVTRSDAQEFLALAVEVPLATTHLVYRLDDVNKALCDMEEGAVRGAAVIDPTGV